MSFLSKIRSSRNSVVVKDDLPLGDCDVVKVRIIAAVQNRTTFSDTSTWPLTLPDGAVGSLPSPYCSGRAYGIGVPAGEHLIL